MAIPFTQYLRPDGRKVEVVVDRPRDVEKLAEEFIEAGGRFECEHLRTGEASLTASFKVEGEEKDIAIQICRNGPDVPNSVDKLVRRAVEWLTTHRN